jgi:hypothetical protein
MWRFLVCLYYCVSTSTDGTAHSAAISQRSEDELNKKLAGNYKLSVTVTKRSKLVRASEARVSSLRICNVHSIIEIIHYKYCCSEGVS